MYATLRYMDKSSLDLVRLRVRGSADPHRCPCHPRQCCCVALRLTFRVSPAHIIPTLCSPNVHPTSPAEATAASSTAPRNTRKQLHVCWLMGWFRGESSSTSLKLSKAARMMSCPPLTRHTAASSSSTRALVLQREGKVVM